MPADFVRSLSALGLAVPTNDEQDYVMVPNKSGRFVGAMVQTNQWGFRDKDYTLARPANTYRMALVGPSTAMASGVEAADSFEAIVEDRLNAEARGSQRFEVLNFGVAGYAPLHVLFQLPRKVFQFEPNAVMYLGHASDIDRTAMQFSRTVRKGIAFSDPYLQNLAVQTGITAGTGLTEARRRMKPHTLPLQQWVYDRIVAECRTRGIAPIFVYLETVTEPREPWRAEQRAQVIDMARKSGFEILDLTGVYAPHQPEDLWIMTNDGHANVLGNRLIGVRLHDLLTRSSVASTW
jgi:hypothetical protein